VQSGFLTPDNSRSKSTNPTPAAPNCLRPCDQPGRLASKRLRPLLQSAPDFSSSPKQDRGISGPSSPYRVRGTGGPAIVGLSPPPSFFRGSPTMARRRTQLALGCVALRTDEVKVLQCGFED